MSGEAASERSSHAVANDPHLGRALRLEVRLVREGGRQNGGQRASQREGKDVCERGEKYRKSGREDLICQREEMREGR